MEASDKSSIVIYVQMIYFVSAGKYINAETNDQEPFALSLALTFAPNILDDVVFLAKKIYAMFSKFLRKI
jgi:hypothetical protein